MNQPAPRPDPAAATRARPVTPTTDGGSPGGEGLPAGDRLPFGDLAREQAHTLLAALEQGGLSHLVISSGSRSTPLTLAAAERARRSGTGAGLILHDIVDERSAAFFALGLSRATGVAAGLLCTSGSAAAHYHPAVLEAAHAGLPLLVLSADRPPEAQGRGAHQTIDQSALFREVCRSTETLGLPDGHPDTLRGVAHRGARAMHQTLHPHPGPVHLVAPFRKPLEPIGADLPGLTPAPRFFAAPRVSDPAGLSALAARCRSTRRGLLLAGPLEILAPVAREAVWQLAELTGFPVIAEAGSQLRLDGKKRPARIDHFPAILLRGVPEALRPELILRVGAEPSTLGLATWLRAIETPEWLLCEDGAADGENRSEGIVEGPLASSLPALAGLLGEAPDGPRPDPNWLAAWRSANVRAEERLEGLRPKAELDDASVLYQVLRSLGSAGEDAALAQLMLGNSLPLRMADLGGPGQLASARVITQRGVSGIDGAIAGAAGLAWGSMAPVTLVLGDLSLSHDLGSLGLLSSTPPSAPVTVVVVNNGGGRIFEALPLGRRPEFAGTLERHLVMPQGRSFESAAAHFGLAYSLAKTPAQLEAILATAPKHSRLIEAVVPPHAARELLRALAAESGPMP